MKKIFGLLAYISIYTFSFGQTVYSNGPLSTGTISNNGTPSPAGYTWSELQNNSSNNEVTNTDLGFPSYSNSDGFAFSLSDNFTIPENDTWSLTNISVFAYSINRSAGLINDIKVRIWNKEPGTTGAEVIYGDLVTNRFLSSSDTKTYRIQNTLFDNGAAGFQRNIFKINATVNITLPAGNYWLEWQTSASDSTVHFSPAVTLNNLRTKELSNGKMYDFSIEKWYDVEDVGGPDSAAVSNISQDLPFEITYDKVLPVEIINFTGKEINNAIILQWQTTNEINNKGFDIERKNATGTFTSVGYVESKSSSSNNTYLYSDKTVEKGKKYFYRLKQVSLNGQYKYSKVIEVSTSFSNSIFISPTIAASTITLHIPGENSPVNHAYITDAQGKAVMILNQVFLPGSNNDINISSLARGIYFMVLQTGTNKRETLRFEKK